MSDSVALSSLKNLGMLTMTLRSSEAILKMYLTRLRRTGAQWTANIRGGFKTDSKCANTVVYAPLLDRFSPCFVEHLNFLRSDVESRIHAGDVIYYF
jgi:hypothetical protein